MQITPNWKEILEGLKLLPLITSNFKKLGWVIFIVLLFILILLFFHKDNLIKVPFLRDNKNYVDIVFLTSLIIIFSFIVMWALLHKEEQSDEEKIIQKLGAVGDTQIKILVECYVKDTWLFNEKDFKKMSEEISDFEFPDDIRLLINNNIISTITKNNHTTYEIQSFVREKLNELLPKQNDLKTWRKLQLANIKNELSYIAKEANFRLFKLEIFKTFKEKISHVASEKFKETEAKNMFNMFYTDTKSIKDQLEKCCFINSHDKNTFTILENPYTNTPDEVKKRRKIEDDLTYKAGNCLQIIDELEKHFDCKKRIKKGVKKSKKKLKKKTKD
jgi:hypothetical protein